jgi:hypothetical protein
MSPRTHLLLRAAALAVIVAAALAPRGGFGAMAKGAGASAPTVIAQR